MLCGYGTNAGLDPRITLPATLAALLWAKDPQSYRPREALAEAAQLVGPDPGAIVALSHLAGASPVEESPGGVALAIMAALSDPAVIDESASVLRSTLSDIAQLAEAPGFAEWVATCKTHLEAGLLGLELLAGRSEDDAVLQRAIDELRAEERSVASGSVPMLLDHVRGRRGAPDPHWPDG